MHRHRPPPRARKDGLLVEELGDELLLYDRDSHTAHCLSPNAACVWRHCDGKRDVTELAVVAGVSEDLVADALHKLRDKNLLEAEPELMQSTVAGLSRREAIGRVARYGAAAALIVSATAAPPAMASSVVWFCNPEPGTANTCCLCNNECTNNGTKTECDKRCGSGHGFEEHASCLTT
jgi:hypothetical protein